MHDDVGEWFAKFIIIFGEKKSAFNRNKQNHILREIKQKKKKKSGKTKTKSRLIDIRVCVFGGNNRTIVSISWNQMTIGIQVAGKPHWLITVLNVARTHETHRHCTVHNDIIHSITFGFQLKHIRSVLCVRVFVLNTIWQVGSR